MKASVEKATRSEVCNMILALGKFTGDESTFFRKCILRSRPVWRGYVDDALVGIWGLIPPTLISDQAYLWLYATEALKGNEFLFVRHSQIEVRKMLKDYSLIHGHAMVENTRGIRWLRWLGAEFSEPIGCALPFVIRRK